MTKLWFRTKNDQIVDLNQFTRFSITEMDEDTNENCIIADYPLREDDGICSILCFGRLDTKEEAQAYLDEIYKILKYDQFNHLEAICADICTIAHKLEEIKQLLTRHKNDSVSQNKENEMQT